MTAASSAAQSPSTNESSGWDMCHHEEGDVRSLELAVVCLYGIYRRHIMQWGVVHLPPGGIHFKEVEIYGDGEASVYACVIAVVCSTMHL